jgi:hypothetical protein
MLKTIWFRIVDSSRLVCTYMYGTNESFCSRAYVHQEHAFGWWLWVQVFTERHCRRVHNHYWPEDEYNHHEEEV